MSVSSGSRHAIWLTIFPLTPLGKMEDEDSLLNPTSLGQVVSPQRGLTVGGKGRPFKEKE
jgi:hypothetical protein